MQRTRRPPASQRPVERSGLEAGTPAPAFELPTLGEGRLSLDDYRGRRVLLVFSDPDCGPCGELAPHLERIHRARSNLDVVMVSRNAERTRAKVAEQGLSFPVVLQRRWEISRRFGMLAFPVGYLIDEQGVIAAPVAAGPGAVLALAGEHPPAARDQVRARIDSLRAELEKGEAELDRLERRRTYVYETTLRIAGAIEALDELRATLDGTQSTEVT